MKYLIIFSALLFFSCHHSEPVSIFQDDPTTERKLENIEPDDLRELVKLRKNLRNNKSSNSIFKEVNEIGPNSSEGLCYSNGLCLSGMVKSMVIDSENDSIFVIATQTGGAWVSYDKGGFWVPIDDDWAGVVMNWVIQDKLDPNIFYFCCKGPGLLVWDKSKDDGLVEWEGTINGIEDSRFDESYYLKFDPDNINVHYLAGGDIIYKYENGEYNEMPRTHRRFYKDGDFEVVPEVGMVIAASDSIHTLKNDGSYFGISTGVIARQGSEIAFSPSNPEVLYSFAFAPSDNVFNLYRSINGGQDWEQFASPFSNTVGQLHDQTLEIHDFDGSRELIIIGTVRMAMSIVDKGHVDPPIFKRLHVAHLDYHGTLKDKDDVYFYNDGGLFKVDLQLLNTTNSSIYLNDEATPLYNGLNTLQIVELAVHDSLDRLAFGVWHSGSWFKNRSGDYFTTSGGDGFESSFHPTNDNLLYSSLQNNIIMRYDISVPLVIRISKNVEAGPFKTKLFTHFSRPNDLFYLDNGIHMISDAASCPEDDCVGTKLCDIRSIQKVQYDKSERDQSVFLNTYNEIYELPDLGSAECNIVFEAPSSTSFRYLYLNENEEVGTIHILLQNHTEDIYEVLKIKRQSSGEFELVETISLNFPTSIATREFLVVGDEVKHIVIGTTAGLFVARYGDDEVLPELFLPNIRVEDLDFDKKENKIYITTYGRGIWSATLKDEFPSSVVDVKGETALEVYPNPSIDHINIHSIFNEELLILNSQGMEVASLHSVKEGVVTQDVADLSPGIYWIIGVKTGEVHKFLKM